MAAVNAGNACATEIQMNQSERIKREISLILPILPTFWPVNHEFRSLAVDSWSCLAISTKFQKSRNFCVKYAILFVYGLH